MYKKDRYVVNNYSNKKNQNSNNKNTEQQKSKVKVEIHNIIKSMIKKSFTFKQK